MESEASAGTSHVATSATTTSSHELDLFSILHPDESKMRLSFARKRFLRFN